jgi:hypothetical protein
VNPDSKSEKPQCEWSEMSGLGATSTLAQEYRVYVSDALPNFNCDIEKEQAKEYLTHHADQLRLHWDTHEIQGRKFIKLSGTILEPRPSLLERFKAEIARFLAAVLVVVVIRAIFKNKNGISRPPGSTIFAIADFFCCKKTVEGIVTPLIADMQFEYNEALAAKRKYKAGWVRVRGCWSLFKALGMYSILKTFVEVWRKISSV